MLVGMHKYTYQGGNPPRLQAGLYMHESCHEKEYVVSLYG